MITILEHMKIAGELNKLKYKLMEELKEYKEKFFEYPAIRLEIKKQCNKYNKTVMYHNKCLDALDKLKCYMEDVMCIDNLEEIRKKPLFSISHVYYPDDTTKTYTIEEYKIMCRYEQ